MSLQAASTWRFAFHPDLVTGAIALREGGGFLLAVSAGLCLFDPDSGEIPAVIAHPEVGKAGVRFNDGRCDRRGRFWVGSMHDTQRVPSGTLCYRFDTRHYSEAVFSDFRAAQFLVLESGQQDDVFC